MSQELMPHDRRLVNVVQACTYLSICRSTIYNWMRAGLVEYVQMPSGRRLIYADTLIRKPEAN